MARTHRLRRAVAWGCLTAMVLAGGCEPHVSVFGDIWIPQWAEGFDLQNLHVYVDVAGDTVELGDLTKSGIASAPVGHQEGISIHPRYVAGFEPAVTLHPSPRNIEYLIEVAQPAAVVDLRLWIDMNGNQRLDRGDLEGRPRGRSIEAGEVGLLSCDPGGAQADAIIWQTRES